MIRLLSGDCRDVLPTLAAESVQCVVCSPPYYGLRDYGTALWDGGDAGCDHKSRRTGGDARVAEDKARAAERGYVPSSNFANYGAGWTDGSVYRDTCGKCGAVRVDRQIGLEATPEAYLQTMVGVFREVKRVLRQDGTCWVNMGDSYAHGPSQDGSVFRNGRNDGRKAYEADKPRGREISFVNTADKAPPRRHSADGTFLPRTDEEFRDRIKPKDLLLMPARLALALQADGWWVRSDIIWHKPNPMPESVTDRPTSAHEHVFLLTRSARYFYDADAVWEEITEASAERYGYGWNGMWVRTRQAAVNEKRSAGFSGKPDPNRGRNLRNVWTIATSPYPNAHFATYPAELAERCIKAGTSERGCCAACGKPWVRVTQGAFVPTQDPANLKAGDKGLASPGWNFPRGRNEATTTGWAPSCQCDAATVPCTVLDPFAGAGTTLLVADRLQRDAIGIELNPEYLAMTQQRIESDAGLFANVGEDHPQNPGLPLVPPENGKADITLLDYLERATSSSDAELCDAPAEDPEETRMADLFTDMAAD